MAMATSQRKPKILYLITKANWGGAQRYVFDLARAMPQQGFETAIMSQQGPLLDRADAEGIKTYALESLDRDIDPLKDVRAFFQLLKILRSERPDILHLNSSKAGGLGALAGRLAGVRAVIFTAHGWAMGEAHRPFLQRALIYIVSWITLLLCHHVITVSEFDRRQGLSFPFASGKILTIYNGVTPFEHDDASRLRRELLPGAQKLESIWIGTTAELHFNKGIDVALEALNTLHKKGLDFIYIVLGEGEERAPLETYVREKNLEKKVHLLGHRAQAARYAPAFDIFLLPSRKEGFPYALLEAGVSGRAVVASAVGGIPEIILESVTGRLFPARNAEALATVLESLIKDVSARESYGAALKHSVATQFTENRMIEETAALYRARLHLYT